MKYVFSQMFGLKYAQIYKSHITDQLWDQHIKVFVFVDIGTSHRTH